jgi:ABC-type multidrug transport system permease subunit
LASGQINDLKNSFSLIENPVEDLDNLISDLKNYEDSSLIDSEISHLEDLSSEISTSFDSLVNVNSQSNSIKAELDSVISNLNSLIISLNSLNVGNAEDIVSPIEISLESVDGSNSKREYIFPIVFSLISLFGAILISSTLVLKNKKTLAYFRNFVTPTRDFTFIFSIYLTCLVILLIQFILVFMGVYFIFDMNFFVLPFETSIIFILGWSVFIFVGTFLGYMLRSEESIIFSSVLVASFLMFFSDLILPLENISEELFKIASYNPLVVMQSALKRIYLFELGFEEIWVGLVVLGCFVFIFGTLSYFVRKATKRNL